MCKRIHLYIPAAVLFFVIIGITWPGKIYAQASVSQPQLPVQQFFRAQIVKITQQGEKNIYGYKNIYQDLQAKILDGPQLGRVVSLENGGQFQITPDQKVTEGEEVILTQLDSPDGRTTHVIADKYRLNWLPYFLIAFAILIIAVAGKKGVGALLGLAVSLGVISAFLVPQILNGQNPLYATIIGSLIILLVTTYLAHGVSKQTTIALVSTFFSLIITAILSIITVNLTKLAGVGNEDAVSLKIGQATANINLQGLLLSGIIIGTLGALNDITTTQAATIFEFAETDHTLNFAELYRKGLKVGKEHIASLINTLILAYAGSSLALFIYFILNPAQQPYWVILNNETIFDEIMRTLVGSAGLITAVPIVTLLAAWYVSKNQA